MILKGRSISPGKAEAEVIKYDSDFSFLGGVNASTGELNAAGGNIAEKVFVFPGGKGSTVGSFVMYDLKVHGKAPAAIINKSAETIVTTGAVISSIPMVDSVDTDLLQTGDKVAVDGDDGTVEIKGIKIIRVVSSVIYDGGKILMLKRPDNAKSFPGRWSLVAGKIENGERPDEAAVREIMEETQIKVNECDVSIPPVYVREENTIWEVYPFLFRTEGSKPILNKENVCFEWKDLNDILENNYFVPLTNKVISEMLSEITNN